MTSSPTFFNRIFFFLARLLAFVLSLLLCLPVILLPLATAVPALLWILLAVLAVALGVVYPQLWEVDFRQQATELDVPVYFLLGRHDINAPAVLAEEYFHLLDAPHKEVVWFEHSGHTPWVSESDRFVQAMVDTVLAQTRGSGS